MPSGFLEDGSLPRSIGMGIRICDDQVGLVLENALLDEPDQDMKGNQGYKNNHNEVSRSLTTQRTSKEMS